MRFADIGDCERSADAVQIVRAALLILGLAEIGQHVVDTPAGIAGLVIDGGVRDVAALEKRRFPVFARGIAMRACIKLHAPSVGEPIVIADVAIARGDLIVADADGVVAIPQAQVERTLAGARQRTDKEAAIMQRLRAGETTVQILGLKSGK